MSIKFATMYLFLSCLQISNMDEMPGLAKPDCFFDDGDDGTIGRMDAGENPEDYGLYEVI